jgi:tetratricopeptide (TPR) repeat protein
MYSRPMVRGVVLALLIIAAASSPQAQTAKTPQTQTQHAAAMIAEGNADDALQLLDTILASKPNDREATMVKMDALIALERTPEAAALYDNFVGTAGKHDVPMARHLAQAELRHLAVGDRPAVKEAAADLLKKSGEAVPVSPSTAPPALPITPSTTGKAAAPQTKPLPMQTPDQILGNDKSTDEQRLGALTAITAPVSAPAIQGIRKALASPVMRMKTTAIDAVQRLDLRELAPDLKPLLADEVIFVKLKAAAALRQFGDHAGDEVLQSVLKSEYLAGRLIAARALRADGDKTSWIPAIATLLGSPRPTERVLAAELLLDTNKSADAVKVLRENLNAADPPARADAARVLAQQSGANPWDFLPLMKDPNPAVRVQAAGVLVRALPAAAAAAKPAAANRPAAGRRK